MRILFSSAVKFNGMYYCVGQNVNGIFSFNEKNGEVNYVYQFDEELEISSYVNSFLYQNELWLIPGVGNSVLIVNLDTFDCHKIDISECHATEGFKFVNYLLFNQNYVCLIPNGVEEALIINLNEKKIENSFRISSMDSYYFSGIFKEEKIILYPWHGRNRAIIDYKLGTINYEEWDEADEAYGDAYYDIENNLVIHAPARSSRILIENLNDNSKCYLDTDFSSKEYYTYFISKQFNKLIIWGLESNYIIRYDLDRQDIDVKEIQEKRNNEYFWPISKDSCEAILFGGNKIIKLKNDEIVLKELQVNQTNLISSLKEHGYSFEKMLLRSGNRIESMAYSLNDYIWNLKDIY